MNAASLPSSWSLLFPRDVVIETALATEATVQRLDPLHRVEEPDSPWAEKRLREYRAGRHVARRALERLGFPSTSLPRDENGLPVFPAGVTASLSHTGQSLTRVACAARLGGRGLGLDLEEIRPFRKELAAQIGTRPELELLRAPNGDFDERLALGLFSAKEAFYKCLYPRLRTFFSFADVVLLEIERQSLERAGIERAGIERAGIERAGELPEAFGFRLWSEKARILGGPETLCVRVLFESGCVASGVAW